MDARYLRQVSCLEAIMSEHNSHKQHRNCALSTMPHDAAPDTSHPDFA